MAEVWATTAGSIDVGANWNTGSVPTSADDVYLNNRAMTSSGSSDITWLSLRNTAGTTAVAGGTLTISAARKFTLGLIDVRKDATTVNGLIQITAASGLVEITGDINGTNPSGATSYGIGKTGACDFNFNGTLTHVAGQNSALIYVAAAGIVNIGTEGSPVSCPDQAATGAGNLVIINHASCDFTMYANQFKGGPATAVYLLFANSALTVGPAIGGSTSSKYGIQSVFGAGKLHTHNGTVTGGSAGSAPAGILKSGAGDLIINGNITTSAIATSVYISAGNTTINGNVDSSGVSAITVGGGSLTISGAITRSVHGNTYVVTTLSAANLTINPIGEIVGGNGGASSHTIVHSSSGTLTINGDVRGGAASAGYGVSQTGNNSTVTINGTVYAGAQGSGLACASGASGATAYVNKAVGNDYGLGSSGPLLAAVGVTNLGNAVTVYVKELEDGPRGNQPISGPVLILEDPVNKVVMRKVVSGATLTMQPGSSGGLMLPFGFDDL